MDYSKAVNLCELQEALHYLHVIELKLICQRLDLPQQGKKAEMIHRIVTFLQTGKIVSHPKIPEHSCACPHQDYPLRTETHMMHGAYKNDARTRAFFQKIIGSHFHFTVYGLDWLKECWMKGKPSTYGEFASFWQQEYEKRKGKKTSLKQEWAYLNFTCTYLVKHPHVSKKELLIAWEKIRMLNVQRVEKILQHVLHKVE